jgi:hypothetical protein
MKGKAKLWMNQNEDKSLGGDFYAGGKSKVAAEAKSKAEGFKKGGKAVKMAGEKSKASAARMPRKAGGKVMSSAAGGTPRGKSSHY